MPLQGTQHHIIPPFEVLDINDIDELPANARDEFYEVLDGIENNNIGLDQVEKICNKYEQYPCFALLHVDILNAYDEQELAFTQLNEAIKKHPTSLGLKINLGRMYVYYNMLSEFEDLMSEWLDIYEIKIKEPLYLNDFYQLVMLYVDYFHIEEDKELLTHIYCWTLHERFKKIAMNLSVEMIKKQYELEEYSHFEEGYGVLSTEEIELDEEYQVEEQLKVKKEINVQFFEEMVLNENPHHPIIQEIMGVDDFMDLDTSQLQQLDKLIADEKLVHDVHWMIKECILSGLRDNAISTEHIITAVFIIGAKKLKECVPVVLRIYDVHDSIGYKIYNDDELHIVGNSIGSLLDDHVDMVDQMLKDGGLHWYHKSILFQIIAFRLKTGDVLYTEEQVKALAAYYYQQGERQTLTWLCQAFISYAYVPLRAFFEQDKFLKLYNPLIVYFTAYDEDPIGINLDFEFSMEEIYLRMSKIYSRREAIMNELMDEFEQEEIYHSEAKIQQIWEILNLNAIESIKQSSADFQEDSLDLNFSILLGTEFSNNESCPCGSGRPYKKCCFNLN